MKLSECTFGRMVITDEMEVGHVVGVTYTGGIEMVEIMSDEQKFQNDDSVGAFCEWGARGTP